MHGLSSSLGSPSSEQALRKPPILRLGRFTLEANQAYTGGTSLASSSHEASALHEATGIKTKRPKRADGNNREEDLTLESKNRHVFPSKRCQVEGCLKQSKKSKDGSCRFCKLHMREFGLESVKRYAFWKMATLIAFMTLRYENIVWACCSHAKCKEPGCSHAAKASTLGEWLYCKGHQRAHGMQPRDYQQHKGPCGKKACRHAPKEEVDPLDIVAADWHTPEPLRALAAEARAASSEHLSATVFHPGRSIALFGPELSHPSVLRAAAKLALRQDL